MQRRPFAGRLSVSARMIGNRDATTLSGRFADSPTYWLNPKTGVSTRLDPDNTEHSSHDERLNNIRDHDSGREH